MKSDQFERVMLLAQKLTRVADILAITTAHVGAAWLALHMNKQRANHLIEQVETKMDWRMERYSG